MWFLSCDLVQQQIWNLDLFGVKLQKCVIELDGFVELIDILLQN